MKTNARHLLILLGLCTCCTTALAADATNPFIGRWALTIPGGGAGWLGVEQKGDGLKSRILWGGGSVVPTAGTDVDEDILYVVRSRRARRKDASSNTVYVDRSMEVITARAFGDELRLTLFKPNADGSSATLAKFTGKRIPPLPPAPDLSKVKYGRSVTLFNGEDLSGWELTNPHATSAWSAKKGVLVNSPAPRGSGPRVHYGNLRTVDPFEDFRLTLEVNVPPRGNSGVYLRGVYEVQVMDSHGRDLDSHHMGAIYSRITPTVSAEKPAGQWQTMEMTLLDRHVTVVLNGTRIIDNQPLLGCTGGALTSDEFRPGPIYLQGDHTAVSYRNIVLTEIVK
jgi:hypothetical protein